MFRRAGAAAARLQLLPALLAVAAVKLLLLAFDAGPRFFLWDTVTYLQGAVGGPLPRDRSFLYSLLIKAIAVPSHSLFALVLAQTFAGMISALLVYLMLRAIFAVRFELALIGAVAVALEPAQLFYEHMVMAEAFGGTLWLAFVLLALAYLRDGRTFWLPLTAAAGILAVSFRLNGTLVILLVSSLLPLLRVAFDGEARRALPVRQLAWQLAIAVACTGVLHVGYRHVVAAVAHTEPGYIGTEGLFRLGFVAPAVQSRDFADTGCSADVLSKLQRPLRDPRTREYQLWGDAGLWAAMRRECPRPEAAANLVAARAGARILGRVLPMALATVAQYFDHDEATWRMDSDLGRKGMLPLELIEISGRWFDFDPHAIAYTDTLTSVWFEHARWWLTACFLLAPVVAAALLWRLRRRGDAPARLLVLIMVLLFLSQFLLSPVIAFRYLHPFPPLVILCLVLIAARQPARVRRGEDLPARSIPATTDPIAPPAGRASA